MVTLFGWLFEPASFTVGVMTALIFAIIAIGAAVLLLAWTIRQERKLTASRAAVPPVARVLPSGPAVPSGRRRDRLAL